MFVFGFLLGLAVGVGFWLWQQTQLIRYLKQTLRSLSSEKTLFFLPLLPRSRQDISTTAQSLLSLRQQLLVYQDLINFAPIGYLLVDEENQLLWCNELGQKMLSLQRWQPGQVRLLLELVRSYELDRLIEKTRDTGFPQTKEWVFHPSCENPTTMVEIKSLALRASSLPLSKGQVGVFLENRQPLVDMTQSRDRAFSELAHELRTPLTSIRLVAETLQERLESPLNRWVSRLMQEVDRLINLVQTWLDLTQLETNPSLQVHREPTDLYKLITSVWESLEPLALRQQLSLSYSGPPDLVMSVDPSRMYQVFLNLLDNSIKYSPPGGKICVDVKILLEKHNNLSNPSNNLSNSSTLSTIEINIIDSGVGFSEADLPLIFERFYRGDQARTSRPVEDTISISTKTIVGSGLGLSIVRQIILAHDATIRATNHPETGGAWLQLHFPENLTKP